MVESGRHPLRNRVLLLSTKAGMRVKEIAMLSWEMVTDVEDRIGDVIGLPNRASKGRTLTCEQPLRPYGPLRCPSRVIEWCAEPVERT
jgi:hypothetical protein